MRPGEFLERLRVSALVRVVLDRELAEGLLDVVIGGILRDTEKRVVLLIVNLVDL